MDQPLTARVRDAIGAMDPAQATRIADLHLWRVGKARYACILSLVTHDRGLTPERVKARLHAHPELAHVTVEIHQCD